MVFKRPKVTVTHLLTILIWQSISGVRKQAKHLTSLTLLLHMTRDLCLVRVMAISKGEVQLILKPNVLSHGL